MATQATSMCSLGHLYQALSHVYEQVPVELKVSLVSAARRRQQLTYSTVHMSINVPSIIQNITEDIGIGAGV